MSIWLILALILTGLEVLALRKNWRRLEYIIKPGLILCLLIWLYASTGLQGDLLFFGLGLLFSLAGDILLMFPNDRLFIPGLVAFFFTHIFYLLGFQEQLLNPSAWSFILLFFVVWNGIRLLRRIVAAMRARGEDRLVYPVVLYGLVLSLMLYAAMSTIFDPQWSTGGAFFVSVGAFLFWISDLILAWDRFVSPVRNGRIFSMLAYHLGQTMLIAGVISQFTTSTA